MQKRRLLLAMLLCAFWLTGFAQKTVTGTVKDASGEPMIGVSVVVDGTSIGGITDYDGNFTIQNAPDNAVLKISYVGYKDQKIPTAGKNSFNVTLQEDAMGLDEVVVVGYGTMKKKDLTGSVASVKLEDLGKVAGANALSAMQAKVPGVDLQTSDGQAGAGVSMKLRGNRSILASNGPLVLVDGVEYGSTLDIPASEIESMDILKDAASTAIYGTKGANGVIIITTKRGKPGKTQIGFNAYWSFNSAANVIHQMTGNKEVQRLVDEANYQIAKANGWDFSTANATIADVLGTTSIADGTLMTDIIADGSYTDWLDHILTNSTSQNYEVNVSGGSDKTNFNVALSLMNDKGLMKNDQFKRYTGRANVDHEINKYLRVGTSLSFAYKDNDKRNSGVYNQAMKMTTITHAYLNDGTINETPNPLYAAHCSPLLDDIDGRYQHNIETTRFFGSAYVQITPVKNLILKSNFTVDRSNRRTGIYRDYLSQSNFQNPKVSTISHETYTSTKYVWQNTANYSIELGDHDFSFLLGHEASQTVTETATVSGNGGAEHYYTSAFYDLSKISSASRTASSSYIKTAMMSYFARVNYSYMNRYLLQASLRADGSSVLAEGKKWGYFPSVSAGWRITEEKFMENSKSWLENLKLRASWGLSGNAAIDAYQTLATVSALTPNSTYMVPMSMANPDLTWEKTSAFDIGLDFGFLGGRINGSIDFYTSKTYDLLYYQTAPNSSVYASTLANVGKTKGHGWEIALNAIPVKTKDFQWDINASGTFSRDEVEELNSSTTHVLDANGYGYLAVGEPVSAFWTYEATNCWGIGEWDKYVADMAEKGITVEKPDATYGDPGTIRVIDQNNDGKINSEDKIVYNRSPKAILGMTNTFSYKGFTLSVQMMARLGGYMYYSGNSNLAWEGTNKANWGDVNYWSPTNTNTIIPTPGLAAKPAVDFTNAICIQKADYFKIKDITLAYQFDKNLLKHVYLNSARVYCSLKNFITSSKIDGYDSERGGAVTFPLAKQVVLGVNLTF